MSLVIEGIFRNRYGSGGLSYQVPALLRGSANLGFMVLPYYRAWVVVVSLAVCCATWLTIEKTRLGALLRASTDNAPIVQSFGVNVPRLLTLTYAAGVGLAAFAGVLAAPIYSVNPLMGTNLIIVVFAVVVVGGMGSIGGAMISGLALGILEGLAKVFYPQASATVIFVAMVIVLLIRPEGLFGRTA
jgi:branched-chain amino acid transport system permease protein